MDFLIESIANVSWQNVVMWFIGALLIFLAIKFDMEPSLLLPMGFGAILVNIPLSNVVNDGETAGIIDWMFEIGIEASEAMPILLFIGIGAMIDFGPLLSNPKLFLLGGAAQFGIFMTLLLATLFGFGLNDAASIAIIGAADGPTSIVVAQALASKYLGPITIVAYSYMALVPIIQPAVVKLMTTKKERLIRMEYNSAQVSRTTKILFPIVVTVVAGLIAPKSLALVGFLMFGNLLRECGVLDSLSRAAQDMLSPLITLLLGLAISPMMKGEALLQPATLMIMAFGLVAFIFDTACGVIFLKIVNIFLPKDKKVNPLVGGAGISAFPMSSRVVQKVGIEANKQNHLLPFALGANVSGQIASVLAGGLLLSELLPIFG